MDKDKTGSASSSSQLQLELRASRSHAWPAWTLTDTCASACDCESSRNFLYHLTKYAARPHAHDRLSPPGLYVVGRRLARAASKLGQLKNSGVKDPKPILHMQAR